MNANIEHCHRRIAEEEESAASAPSFEAALSHEQAAMLYRAQLTALVRHQRDRGGMSSQYL
jgi:hypothetical protein